MKKSNPLSDFIQFIIGGCFFAAGVFLLSNQVMVRATMAIGGAIRSGYGRGWGAGSGHRRRDEGDQELHFLSLQPLSLNLTPKLINRPDEQP